jgi:2-C-methyl-D-erythritol 4-phosphate cytidylyltransferase
MLEGRKVAVVIPAAGKGSRIGGSQAKQFLDLGGRPILVRTIGRFQASPLVDCIVVAAPPEQVRVVKDLVTFYHLNKVVEVVSGGRERQDSVWNGLQSLSRHNVEFVLVHDAARPFVPDSLIEDVCNGLVASDAVIPGIVPNDTVKRVNPDGVVAETLRRPDLRLVQTPQGFRLNVLLKAYELAREEGMIHTDDAGVVERSGVKVRIVQGSDLNIKITTSRDLEMARLMVNETPVT